MAEVRSGERGVALIMALAFMALVVPIVTAALGLASTLAVDSRIKTDIVKSQYSAMGGGQHVLYRLLNEAEYAAGLVTDVPQSYTVDLNGRPVQIGVVRTSSPTGDPPVLSDSSRRLRVLVEVTPTDALPSILTVFTYTVTVENLEDGLMRLRTIYNELPAPFAYLPGSTTGVTALDPSISGRRLTWNLASDDITIPEGAEATLVFTALATVPEGTYCDESWVDPGDRQTTSGKTAPVTVGAPPANLCDGVAAEVLVQVTPPVALDGVPTTHEYTITLRSLGTETLEVSQIRDLLPEGFFYVPGSTSGNVTVDDPNITLFQGQQRLDWTFDPGLPWLPGQTLSLTFNSDGSGTPGTYPSEVWVTVEELEEPLYTWLSATVRVMSVYRITATDGGNTVSFEVWIADGTYIVTLWEIGR